MTITKVYASPLVQASSLAYAVRNLAWEKLPFTLEELQAWLAGKPSKSGALHQ
jgi:hypothetical protein